jgi:hypothetical protein
VNASQQSTYVVEFAMYEVLPGVAGAGYSTGVAVGDYDNDGFDDLFVAGYGHLRLRSGSG